MVRRRAGGSRDAATRERRIKRPTSKLAAGKQMAAQRKVFRIEETALPRREPRADETPPHYDNIVQELRVLRATLAAVAPANGSASLKSRPDEIQKLVSELRLIKAALSGTGQEHPAAGRSPSSVRIVEELKAVIHGSEQATQKILKAAEDVDGAANELCAALKNSSEQGRAQDIRDRVIEVFEACNFQDLVSQRVANVISALGMIEQQVTRALDELAHAQSTPPVHGPRLPDDPGHASQADIDALFAGDARSRQ